MAGRLADVPGFVPSPWRGLGTRGQRLYLLYALALNPYPDNGRAQQLLDRLSGRWNDCGLPSI